MSYTYLDKTNELHHVHCVISIVLFNRYQFRELIKKIGQKLTITRITTYFKRGVWELAGFTLLIMSLKSHAC